jgi:ligand-binding sensor domain-containing protein
MCDYLRGPVWQEIDRGLPKRYVSSITFAPHSSTTLYVTFSGFDQNTPGGSGHVFVSTNGARAWKNLTGKKAASRLPNLPVTDLLVNPTNGHLYVSADYGVYVSANGGASWQRMDHGLPAADVYQMQYFALKHMLIVATHGRGVWETPAP